MLVTDDEEIFKKCWAYKDHGKSYDAVYHREHAPGFRWLHESFGTNWRMTEIQAAMTVGPVRCRGQATDYRWRGSWGRPV